ncbi:glucosamine--fructose-6-phosphate aminotransferase (isomerizing) [Caldicoprobacter guelmensis]|uniref:glutamine--fructose-6-phosphate transaminase (isomerizing) n=1 Tax=Caldicoprobacter guelmensis TaxID=1170224 RepID=UPI0019577388|nr:glucosamine--fructose-6-phosphate aminotransferase (isomerizing) [Caldicoprobacter guelmensis]
MCGIVGYIGDKQALPILIEGLKRLEYRGYDSAGVAVHDGNCINISKAKGRLTVLEQRVDPNRLQGTLGIGHTRWATHGEPSDINSHPHTNQSGEIAIVHNGIIENYMKLKDWLQREGYVFVSETDTEAVAHLINYYYCGDLVEAVRKALDKIEGSYALGVIAKDHPDCMVAARKDSPLVIGLGDGENYIASDIPAILKYTRKVYLLEDREIALIRRDGVEVIDQYGNKVQKELFEVTWDVESAEKGGYQHFMIKEIHEEPKALRDTMASRIVDGKVNLSDLNITKEQLEKAGKIIIIACGTAYHAGVVGKYVIEKLARIPVDVEIASEFRYKDPLIDENNIVIIISQSGETADTLAAMRMCKKVGAKVIAVTNVVGSTVSREADHVVYTWAGPEIAVASTKAYTTQLLCMYMMALDFADKLGRISADEYRRIIEGIKRLPELAQKILDDKEVIQRCADETFNASSIFYMGRGLDYAVAMEGSLKLKEISYIHSEAYAAGELKHGTIALIEEGTPVVALATQKGLFEKTLSNIKEVKARGAFVIAVTMEGDTQIEKEADRVIYIPKVYDILAPVLVVIPLQLYAYYVAVAKGCDVDKPRNLAKSVTVE